MSQQMNPSFRTILPAASTGAAGPPKPPGNLSGLPPKTRSVALACNNCRKARIKCNGRRPTCESCAARSMPCSYEDGKARHFATKSRLESLEKLVDALKISTPDEADRILQHLRTGQDLAGVMEDSPGHPAGENPKDGRPASNAASSARQSLPNVSQISVNPNLKDNPEGHEHGHVLRSPGRGSNAEMHPTQVIRDGSYESARALVPNEDITKKAIDAFFGCSGKLFHVFSRQVIDQSHQAVFHGPENPGEKGKVGLCFVMSIASCGAQYVHEAFEEGTERIFYDLARHCSEAVTVYQPRDSIKVCTLLALYNILEKDTVSLSYVESGLGMCRRYGLSCGSSRPSTFTESEWIDYRQTWRTLMFFSSWLSATLGYISGNDVLSERVTLSEVAICNSTDLSEVVQTQITKICLLKANIFCTRLTLKDLTVPAIQSIICDLQDWHRDLPGVMRLSYTGREDFPVEAKRSIFHVHLLYLGSIMLLYRRIASELAQSYGTGVRGSVLPPALEDIVAEVAGEAVLAARTSARILMLLHEESGVFKRCWLVIFQTYTACIITLHSMAQRRLHKLDPMTLKEEMDGVRDLLTILAFCGSSDRVATDLREQLSAIFDTIQAQKQKNESPEMEVDEASPATGSFSSLDEIPGQRDLGDFRYLMTLPPTAEASQVEFCLSLLYTLSRPFTDSFNLSRAENEETRTKPMDNPLTYEENPDHIEIVEWDLEDVRGEIPCMWAGTYRESDEFGYSS